MINKYLLLPLFLLTFTLSFSQDNYHAAKEKTYNLEHTKLKVSLNFKEKQLNGEAWLTLKPYFYPSSTVVLDAKAMLFHEVSLNNTPLPYEYDNFNLTIQLPKTYTKNDSFTLYIKYTARPEKVKDKLTNTFTDKKGLYFVNATGSDKNKPTQVWTQGQTSANSCWFPTIDAPNQKTTQEIYIKVPKKYITISNGTLINRKEEGSFRTDYWKMEKKHAPYLFFFGVGEFEIIKDNYKEVPVNYYVEKAFASNAKSVFGNTPEMLRFFSDKLGVEFPWSSYNQIVVRDYISGAMENTTAVVHGEKMYLKPGQLIDGNSHENTIAHELFHHWFGNLVTAESWANISLNESFANYGEYLWQEYKYGKEAAETHLFENNKLYFESQDVNKSLVEFNYLEEEELFNLVSYNKGGAIIHMLRNYVGDTAFFATLKEYLNTYQFKTAEVHELRLLFEKLTGKDLNWFFNQWFYQGNHPKIEISYDYNLLRKTVTVNVLQLQSEKFQFPLTIDFFEGNSRTRKTVFVENNDASFTFNYKQQPSLIQVNADGVLLAEISENKVLSDYIYQLKNAVHFTHRREALLEVLKKQDDKDAFKAVVEALDDTSEEIKILALENIDLINKFSKKDAIQKIVFIAKTAEKTLVKAAAIETLGKLTDPLYKSIFTEALSSDSYGVLGKSLVALYYVDKDLAIQKSKQLPDEVRKILATPLTKIFIESNDATELPFIAKSVISGMFLSNNTTTKALYEKAFDQIARSNNMEAIKNLTEDMVSKGKQYKQFNFDKVVINLMRKMISTQESSTNSNKERNIAIIKATMSGLVE